MRIILMPYFYEKICNVGNPGGDHLSLMCGHSHLCAYKVSVSATCGRHKLLCVNVPLDK